MGKLKTLGLCVFSVILGITLTVGYFNLNTDMTVKSQLKVTGPTNVSKGDYPEFLAEVTKPSWFQSKAIYQWKVVNSKGVIQHRAVTNSDILVPAGMDEDRLWVLTSVVVHNNYLLWNEVVPLGVVVTPVTVGTPTPTPVPPPPTPIPVTFKGPLFAIGVFDNSNPLVLSEDQLYMHNNVADIQEALKALDTTWKNYDRTNPALAPSSWQSIINTIGAPTLILVDKDGKDYYKGKLISKIDTLNRIYSIRNGVK